MGLVSFDISSDAVCHASGSFYHIANPPAIHLVIPDVEMVKQKFALIQGSGGSLTLHQCKSYSGGSIVVNTNVPNKLAVAVNEISTVFGLTKDELSKVCKVQSRKSLYNWINGEAKPRKSAMQRVFDLLIVARALKSSGLSIDRDNVHEPIVGDSSMFDLLNETDIDQERIIFAASRLHLMTQATKVLVDPFA